MDTTERRKITDQASARALRQLDEYATALSGIAVSPSRDRLSAATRKAVLQIIATAVKDAREMAGDHLLNAHVAGTNVAKAAAKETVRAKAMQLPRGSNGLSHDEYRRQASWLIAAAGNAAASAYRSTFHACTGAQETEGRELRHAISSHVATVIAMATNRDALMERFGTPLNQNEPQST